MESFKNIEELKSRAGTENSSVLLLGGIIPSDGAEALYYWDPLSIEVADNIFVVKVDDVTLGRWKALNFSAVDTSGFLVKPDGIITTGVVLFNPITQLFTVPTPFTLRFNNQNFLSKLAPNNTIQGEPLPTNYARIDTITCDSTGNYFYNKGPNVYSTLLTPPTPAGHVRIARVLIYVGGSYQIILGKPISVLTNYSATIDDEFKILEGRDLIMQAAFGSVDTGDFIFRDGNGVERARIYLAPGPQDKFFIRFGLNSPSYELPLGPSDTTLISGGEVTSALNSVNVAPALFRIEGENYNSLLTNLPSPAAHTDFLRIDIIVGTKNNVVLYIPGTPAETAITPSVPTGTVLIRTINVLAGVAQPEIAPPPATVVSLFEKISFKFGSYFQSMFDGSLELRSKRGTLLAKWAEIEPEYILDGNNNPILDGNGNSIEI